MIKTLGCHLLIDLYACDTKLLADVRAVEEIMVEAAKATRAEIVDVVFHAFRPFGVSGAVVISESHLTIHTWPEYGYAAIDVYTCGKKSNPWKAYRYLSKHFRAKHFNAIELKRGTVQVKRSSR